jgi:hypothetical protein
MKWRMTIILLLLLVSNIQSQTISPYNFYPSAVGNKWQWQRYLNSSTYEQEITKDSLGLNGERYLFFNGSKSATFLVDTSRQVWQIVDKIPTLWYKLDAQEGDSYSSGSYTVNVTSATANAFGHVVPAKIFSWSYGEQYPNFAVQWLVYGVGFYSTYSVLYNLADGVTGYVIDGMKYGTLTNVVNIQKLSPSIFSLNQNYPNPFNPSTTISFTLPTNSLVTLKIYDVLGREVELLANEELLAGTYSRTWDAGAMPSGVYFYRLQAGIYTETKRLLLLR